MSEKKIFPDLKKGIEFFVRSADGYKLIIQGKNDELKIFNTITGQEEKRFMPFKHKLSSISFEKSGKNIICLHNREILKIRLMNYSDFTNIYFLNKILEEKNSIANCISSYPLFFSKNSIKNIVLNSEIYPFNIGVFHFFAYRKDEKKISLLLQLCHFYSIIPKFSLNSNSISDNLEIYETPLDIAIRKNDITSTHLLIKALSKYKFGPNNCPSISIKTLIKLIDCENSFVSELLESRFCEPYYESKIPRTYFSFDDPLQTTMDQVVINEKDLEVNLLGKRTEAIKKTFKKTLLNDEPFFKKITDCLKRRINLNQSILKSDNKNELIKSIQINILDLPGIMEFDNEEGNFLEKCYSLEHDHPIFENKIFLAILQYKWDSYARDYFLNSALIYFIYIVLLLINSVIVLPYRIENNINLYTNINFALISLACDIILMIYLLRSIISEILSLCKLRWLYFFNFWNYIDLPIFYCLANLLIDDFLDIFDQPVEMFDLKFSHSITIFLTFLRFITYARGFESLAFIVRLIFQVIQDMTNFLLIMFFILMSLSCSGNNNDK